MSAFDPLLHFGPPNCCSAKRPQSPVSPVANPCLIATQSAWPHRSAAVERAIDLGPTLIGFIGQVTLVLTLGGRGVVSRLNERAC
jgi:hypothetical protein